MNKEEVLKLAKDFGSVNYQAYRWNDKVDHIAMYEEELLAFANAIADAQREKDAKICDEHASIEGIAQTCAAAIRENKE